MSITNSLATVPFLRGSVKEQVNCLGGDLPLFLDSHGLLWISSSKPTFKDLYIDRCELKTWIKKPVMWPHMRTSLEKRDELTQFLTSVTHGLLAIIFKYTAEAK